MAGTMKPKKPPSTNGDNGTGKGRDRAGRFAVGNPGGTGNPFAKQVQALRSALLGAVTEADIRAAVRQLIKKARRGDVLAIRELLDRTCGRPAAVDAESQVVEPSALSADFVFGCLVHSCTSEQPRAAVDPPAPTQGVRHE